MKNIIKTAAFAAFAMLAAVSYAAIPAYQVYDIKFNARTTEAKGIVELTDGCSAGDYCYREKKNVVIKGVLAGCYCGAILADGSCNNAILYMWDDTHKLPITNVTTTTGWRVQVIGKKQNLVEHFMRFQATYGANDEYSFDVTLCGFGTNRKNAKNPELSYATCISGWFAGTISAPWYYKAGKCSACTPDPDVYEQSVALPMCGCSSYEGDVNPELTPFGGTYSVNYNGTKSSNATKKGISKKTFGLPSYVGLDDYVGTNIGEN